MRTRIKTLAVFAVIASSVLVASAQEQNAPERPMHKAKEFKCPVCGSPCVSRFELMKQRQRMHARINRARAMRADRTPEGQQPRPNQLQRNRQQRQMRFDIDGDGQLSPAERAARRAYVQALQQEQGADQPAPHRPAAE